MFANTKCKQKFYLVNNSKIAMYNVTDLYFR